MVCMVCIYVSFKTLVHGCYRLESEWQVCMEAMEFSSLLYNDGNHYSWSCTRSYCCTQDNFSLCGAWPLVSINIITIATYMHTVANLAICKDQPIMLTFLPIMLCCSAHKICLICSILCSRKRIVLSLFSLFIYKFTWILSDYIEQTY